MPLHAITVLLADDHKIVREGLRALLGVEHGIRVIGEAGDGRETARLVRKLRPAVIVMDIAMPLLNGLEATRQILKALPSAKVLILSAHGDDAYVERAMSLGAAGYLVKQTAAHTLPEAIRKIHGGGSFFSASIASRRDQQRQQLTQPDKSQPNSGSARLSPREMEVLHLIAEGKSNKQTAAELQISIKTVEKHRQKVMDKLGIHDIAGLTRHAISAGIIGTRVQVTIRRGEPRRSSARTPRNSHVPYGGGGSA